MSENKITTGEVVGNLRVAARLFKSFENALEAAELVHSHEKEVKKLQGEIESLEKEKVSLNNECDAAVASANEAEQKKKDYDVELQKAIEQGKIELAAIKNKAREEAKAIIGKAEAKAEAILSDTTAYEALRAQALTAKNKAEAEFELINKKVQAAKESFLSAFG